MSPDLLLEVYKQVRSKVANGVAAERMNFSLGEYLELKEQTMDVINANGDVFENAAKQLFGWFADSSNYGKPRPDFIHTHTMGSAQHMSYAGPTEVEEHGQEEKGEKTVSGIAREKPRTSAEIISVLGIDNREWVLSEYWNKEMKNGLWRISARVVRKKGRDVGFAALMDDLYEGAIPAYQAIPLHELIKPSADKTTVGAVISLQDLHFGKSAVSMEASIQRAIKSMFSRAVTRYNIGVCYLVIGGDLLNADTWTGTTTSGTPVENAIHPAEAYGEAYRVMRNVVLFCAQFCAELRVVYIPGNHDRISSAHLLHALSVSVREPNIIFDAAYDERKVFTYGNNLFCFEHGDKHSGNNPMVYATEHAQAWGRTLYRTLYTGHFHTRRTRELITENEIHGFSTRHLPALCSTDYWHYSNKYTGNRRSAVMDLHCAAAGLMDTIYWSHPHEVSGIPLFSKEVNR